MSEYLSHFQLAYETDPNYWGVEASSLIKSVPAPQTPGRAVALDLGCGQGRNIEALLQQGYSVTAIDILPEATRQVLKRFGERVTVIRASAIDYLALVGKGTADLILANHLIQHLSSLDELDVLLDRAVNVLKVRGYLAIAHFVEPRSAHPELVRREALILSNGMLAKSLAESHGCRIVLAEQLIRTDRHGTGTEPHQHAIERVIAQKVR